MKDFVKIGVSYFRYDAIDAIMQDQGSPTTVHIVLRGSAQPLYFSNAKIDDLVKQIEDARKEDGKL